MLRLKEWLVWKPQEGASDFQVLVASGHDRVFGEMVKQQRMEAKKKEEDEYKKRKLAERAAAKAAGKDLDADGDKSGIEKKDLEKGEKGNEKEKDQVQGEKKEGDGKVVMRHKKDDTPAFTPGTEFEEAKVLFAVPVKDLKDIPEGIKHEKGPRLVGPEAAVDKIDKDPKEINQTKEDALDNEVVDIGSGSPENKKQDVKDLIKVAGKLLDTEADVNAKDEAGAGVGVEGNANNGGDKKGELKMNDIKAAFKALEAAAGGMCVLLSLSCSSFVSASTLPRTPQK